MEELVIDNSRFDRKKLKWINLHGYRNYINMSNKISIKKRKEHFIPLPEVTGLRLNILKAKSKEKGLLLLSKPEFELENEIEAYTTKKHRRSYRNKKTAN